MSIYSKPSGKFQEIVERDPERMNVASLRTECAHVEQAVKNNEDYLNEYSSYVENEGVGYAKAPNIVGAILEDILWEAKRVNVLDKTFEKELKDFGKFELLKSIKKISQGR